MDREITRRQSQIFGRDFNLKTKPTGKLNGIRTAYFSHTAQSVKEYRSNLRIYWSCWMTNYDRIRKLTRHDDVNSAG